MFMGQEGFVWWMGVVEDIADPLLLGRAKVRIFGYHPAHSEYKVFVSDLPWAQVVMPANMPDAYGKLRLGDWVLGFFIDGKEAQEPVILGYIPGLGVTAENRFGENYAAVKNFSQVYPNNSNYTGGSVDDYNARLNRFSFQTPAGHRLEMVDDVSASVNRRVSLFHGNGSGLDIIQDQYGNAYNTIYHPSGSYIQMLPNGGIDIVAHYPGDVNTVQVGAPPRGGGGDCFTEDSFVMMSDGTMKKISEVQVGDYVMNRNRTKSNQVKFIETVVDTTWESLYSPSKTMKPFATINHPLYCEDNLCAVFPKNVEQLYPWLGKISQLDSYLIEPTKGSIVYNLWVDGDGTYIVNGYGTTSILMDGGLLRIAYERGYLSHKEVMDLVLEFTTDTSNLQLGAYIVNGLAAELNIDCIFRFFAWISRKPKTNLFRRCVSQLMRSASVIGRIIYRR